jgi:homocysteine S-methyltransferase
MLSSHHLPTDRFPLLIDGGLSNVLEAQGYDLNHTLWTARLLDQKPEAIIQAHLAYLEAGAQCITTASYQASIPGLINAGYSQADAQKLIRKSVYLSEAAIRQFLDKHPDTDRPLIAASIGPYGAYLADGSEYRGAYSISDTNLREFHEERIHLLADTTADLLAVETIPSYTEARVLAAILTSVQKPVWVSFSCKDEAHINDGTKLEKVVSLFEDHPTVFALGANCTRPEYISGILQTIKASGVQQKIIVYPNSGEAYHAKSKTWLTLSEPLSLGTMAQTWIKDGADIIGGCCRLGPEHIRQIGEVISEGLI